MGNRGRGFRLITGEGIPVSISPPSIKRIVFPDAYPCQSRKFFPATHSHRTLADSPCTVCATQSPCLGGLPPHSFHAAQSMDPPPPVPKTKDSHCAASCCRYRGRSEEWRTNVATPLRILSLNDVGPFAQNDLITKYTNAHSEKRNRIRRNFGTKLRLRLKRLSADAVAFAPKVMLCRKTRPLNPHSAFRRNVYLTQRNLRVSHPVGESGECFFAKMQRQAEPNESAAKWKTPPNANARRNSEKSPPERPDAPPETSSAGAL